MKKRLYTTATLDRFLNPFRPKVGKYTFSFLGATLDAVDMAERMNIRRDNSAHFDKSQMKDSVFNRVSDFHPLLYELEAQRVDLRKF